MTRINRAARNAAVSALVLSTFACSSTGGLGGILGSVLGGGNSGGQVTGTIQGVNTRSRQIEVEQSNGRTVTLTYDNNTQVVYQNQNYPVTSLEFGDRVTARISNSNNNNGNYTDLIQVDQSVSSNDGNSGNVQTFEGTVRSLDRSNGIFTMSSNNRGTVTVSMPYNARQNDISKFNSIRTGDYVRLYGVLLNNSRVELRQFY